MLTPNRVRVGDLAAGTVLVYEHPDPAFLEHVGETAFVRPLRPADVEVMNDLLRRWHSLAAEARGRLGREILRRGGASDDAPDDATLRAALARHAGKSSS
jgi:hypothetical protein